jgi:hypothetical protein
MSDIGKGPWELAAAERHETLALTFPIPTSSFVLISSHRPLLFFAPFCKLRIGNR